MELVNASISGDTTRGGLSRLPDALERFEPDLVVIELGGNDGLRGYPPASMRQNIEQMARLSSEAGAEVLILGMMIPSNYGPAFTQMFSEAFGEAAEATDSALVPSCSSRSRGSRLVPERRHPPDGRGSAAARRARAAGVRGGNLEEETS